MSAQLHRLLKTLESLTARRVEKTTPTKAAKTNLIDSARDRGVEILINIAVEYFKQVPPQPFGKLYKQLSSTQKAWRKVLRQAYFWREVASKLSEFRSNDATEPAFRFRAFCHEQDIGDDGSRFIRLYYQPAFKRKDAVDILITDDREPTGQREEKHYTTHRDVVSGRFAYEINTDTRLRIPPGWLGLNDQKDKDYWTEVRYMRRFLLENVPLLADERVWVEDWGVDFKTTLGIFIEMCTRMKHIYGWIVYGQKWKKNDFGYSQYRHAGEYDDILRSLSFPQRVGRGEGAFPSGHPGHPVWMKNQIWQEVNHDRTEAIRQDLYGLNEDKIKGVIAYGKLKKPRDVGGYRMTELDINLNYHFHKMLYVIRTSPDMFLKHPFVVYWDYNVTCAAVAADFRILEHVVSLSETEAAQGTVPTFEQWIANAVQETNRSVYQSGESTIPWRNSSQTTYPTISAQELCCNKAQFEGIVETAKRAWWREIDTHVDKLSKNLVEAGFRREYLATVITRRLTEYLGSLVCSSDIATNGTGLDSRQTLLFNVQRYFLPSSLDHRSFKLLRQLTDEYMPSVITADGNLMLRVVQKSIAKTVMAFSILYPGAPNQLLEAVRETCVLPYMSRALLTNEKFMQHALAQGPVSWSCANLKSLNYLYGGVSGNMALQSPTVRKAVASKALRFLRSEISIMSISNFYYFLERFVPDWFFHSDSLLRDLITVIFEEAPHQATHIRYIAGHLKMLKIGKVGPLAAQKLKSSEAEEDYSEIVESTYD